MAHNFKHGDTEYEGAGDYNRFNSTDLHYKMCKKISQLTKVVYSLNMRKAELEQLNQMKGESYKKESDLQELRQQLEEQRVLQEKLAKYEFECLHIRQDMEAWRRSQESHDRVLSTARMTDLSHQASLLEDLRSKHDHVVRSLRQDMLDEINVVKQEQSQAKSELRLAEQQCRKLQADLEKSAQEAERSGLQHSAAERRNLVAQEARFREQLEGLRVQVTGRDTENNKLRSEMEELNRDVMVKACGMDRLQAELTGAHKESELMRQKLRQLEDDLSAFKRCNADLAEELQAKTAAARQEEGGTQEMQAKVARLEAQLAEVMRERDRLEQVRADMEAEREEEMKIVQEALEEAQEEKATIQARFEQLRTVNSDREQQLLDDFEWKLREVEQTCKKRLEERDRTTEQRIQEVRRELESRLITAETQLAESQQLRSLTLEQKRTLRAATRQTEQLQVNEHMLKEEIARLKTVIESEKSYAATVQSIHDKHVAEAERKLKTRVHEQKNEITAQWEERLRSECGRLRSELQQLHAEELLQAVQVARQERDQANRSAHASLEKRLEDSLQKIESLRAIINGKDALHRREMENAQTNTDRDIMELRRKLDKLDMSYQEQIEQLQGKHEKEIEHLGEEAERRVQQAEQAWQLQASSTRATLELVKEQLERDAQDRLEALERKHQEQLEVQWERLEQEREEALQVMEQKHREELEALKNELEAALKERLSKENEMQKFVTGLQSQLEDRTSEVGDLQGNMELLQGGVQALTNELGIQTRQLTRTQDQARIRLREREMQLAAEQQRIVDELSAKHTQELQTVREEMQAQILELIARLEVANKQPREEDNCLIDELRQGMAARDEEVARLTKEKQYYQRTLMNRETTYNLIFGADPVVGVMDPLQHKHRRKGGGRASLPPHQVSRQSRRRTRSAPR